MLLTVHPARRIVSCVLGAFATAMFVAVTLLPVVLPVLAVTVLGRRVDPALGAAHRWVTRNSRRIGVAIELIFALYLVSRGIRDLP